MKEDIIDLLNRHRIMSIATVRPDGWPQATIVGYVNDDLLLYFVVSRRSQKFRNLAHDDRVSITIGTDAPEPRLIKGLSMSARASEVTDPDQVIRAYDLLMKRHPELAELPRPDRNSAAIMRALPHTVFLLDYSKGLGHSDEIRIGPEGRTTMTPEREPDWGPTPARH